MAKISKEKWEVFIEQNIDLLKGYFNRSKNYLASLCNKFINDIEQYASKYNDKVIIISAQIEAELSELEDEERSMFLDLILLT